MNFYALGIGLLVGSFILYQLTVRKAQQAQWAFPFLLATFPIYYLLFTLYASDFSAFLTELTVSTIFFAIAYVARRFRSYRTWLLLSIGYLLHGIYDVYHDMLFEHEGIPLWWPEFCGTVDVVIGIYLFYQAIMMRRMAIDVTQNKDVV